MTDLGPRLFICFPLIFDDLKLVGTAFTTVLTFLEFSEVSEATELDMRAGKSSVFHIEFDEGFWELSAAIVTVFERTSVSEKRKWNSICSKKCIPMNLPNGSKN